MTDAIADLKHLLESQEQAFGSDHLKVANTLTAIADVMIAQEKYLDAEPLLWRVLEIRHKTSGQTNLEVACTLTDLASLQEKLNNLSEAERLLRWSLDIRRNLLGSSHPDYRASFDWLCELLVEQGKEVDIEPDQPQSEAPATSVPRADIFCWDHHFQRGTALLDAEEYLAAEVLFDCLVTITKHFAPQTIHQARCLDNLGRARFHQGRYPESLEHFKEALGIFEKTVGSRHLDTVECLEAMADVHAAATENDQARFLYNWALTVSKKEGHAEPAERIKCKLATLPFSAGTKGVDDVLVEKVLGSTKTEAKQRRKTSSTLTKPSVEQVEAACQEGLSGGIDSLLADLALPRKKTTTTVTKPILTKPQEQNAPAAQTQDLTERPPATKKTTHTITKPAAVVAAAAAQSASITDLLSDLALPTKKATANVVKPEIQEEETPPAAPKKRTSTTTKKPALEELAEKISKGTITTKKPSQSNSTADVSRFDQPIQQRAQEIPAPRKKTTSSVQKKIAAETAPPAEPEPDENSESAIAERNLFGNMTDTTPVSTIAERPRKKTTTSLVKPHLESNVEEQVGPEQSVQDAESLAAEQSLFGNMTDRSPASRIVPADPLREPESFKDLKEQVKPSKEPSAWEKLSADAKARRTTFKPWQKPTTTPPARLVPNSPDEETAAAGGTGYMEIFEDKLSTFLFDKYRTSGLRFLQQRNYSEAERMYLLALEKAEEFGARDPRLWQTQCGLGNIYESIKKYGQAEDLYRRSLQMAERTLGAQHADVAKYLQHLARLYSLQDNWQESEHYYKKGIAILKAAKAPQNEISDLIRSLEYVQERGKMN